MAGVKLTWDANPPEDNVLGYVLYVSTVDSGGYKKIGETSSTSYTLENLPLGTTFVKITAFNRYGESAPSEVFSIKAIVPKAPANIVGNFFN